MNLIYKVLTKQSKIEEIIRLRRESIKIKPFAQYKLITVKLNHNGIILRNEVQGMTLGSSNYFLTKKNDLIISRIDARNGAIGILPNELSNSIITNDFLTFEPLNNELINVEYLNFLFQSDRYSNELKKSSEGSTNRVRLKLEKFNKITIPVIPIEEQNQIVRNLKSLNYKIEQIKGDKLNQTKLLDNLLYSLFVDIIKESEWLPMGRIAPIIRRELTIKQNEEYPELGIRSFGKGTFHKPAIKGIDLGTKRIYQIKSGDLLFSNVFAWEGGIAVANENDNNRYGSHRFISCNVNKEEALPEFLCFHHLTPEGMEKIQLASPGGAGRNKTLGLKKLEAIKVPVPPIEKQQKFVDTYYKIQRIKKEIEVSIKDIEGLFPSALHKAFKISNVSATNQS